MRALRRALRKIEAMRPVPAIAYAKGGGWTYGYHRRRIGKAKRRRMSRLGRSQPFGWFCHAPNAHGCRRGKWHYRLPIGIRARARK